MGANLQAHPLSGRVQQRFSPVRPRFRSTENLMRKRFLGGLIPAFVLAALPAVSSAGVFVGVSVNLAPPALPVYEQPPCPEPGYIWTPGYWAWNDGAYYWVPGTWVLPPLVGFLWTPGYWGWADGAYLWHAGYWGRHVGFYGGVHYGFGYDGDGFSGGYWRGSQFFYNRAVAHVGPTFVRNVYYHPVVYHTTYEHVSFSGGPGGVRARPSHEQMEAMHEHHVAFTSLQQRQQRMAFADHSLRADYNHGRPPIAATARPAMFHGRGAFAARAAGGPVPPRCVPIARPGPRASPTGRGPWSEALPCMKVLRCARSRISLGRRSISTIGRRNALRTGLSRNASRRGRKSNGCRDGRNNASS